MSSKGYYVVGAIILILLGGFFFVSRKLLKPASPTPIPSIQAVATPMPTPSVKEVVISLTAEKPSTESGTARLQESNGKLTVFLDLTGAPANTPQPAHIHAGKCPNVGAVKYPLTNVINGKSETTLDTTLDQLAGMTLAINVHKSVPLTKTYVSCGDLKVASGSAKPVNGP